jgi:predicted dehydrogenase
VKRLLLVGLGRFGQNHLRVLSGLDVPLGLVDLHQDALEKARKLVPEARCSRTLAPLLGDAFAADIVVPLQLHAPLATECLEAGLAVFCEKPLATTTDEAHALALLALKRNAVLQTGFVFRYHPAWSATLGLVREGAIGRPHTLRARFTGFKRPRTDGGCATNDAVHFADLASVLFEKPPVSALGVTRDFLGTGREDTAFLDLDFDGGELCHIEASYHAPGRARELLVVGDRGSIAVDFDAQERPVTLHRQSHGGPSAEPESPLVEPGEPLALELEDFLENARRRRQPAADGWAGAQAVAAIEAALVSAREGRKVPVPQVAPLSPSDSL